MREFERWAPNLRVVPWYGEARARDVIKKYELFHKDVNSNRYTDAKFHVLVTTYEAVISPKDFGPIPWGRHAVQSLHTLPVLVISVNYVSYEVPSV